MKAMYKHIAVGGTFDGLHKGHRHFLAAAFSSGARVTIGLTSARYIAKYKKGKDVAPYSRRYQLLTRWLRAHEYAARTLIVPLHDPYGPLLLAHDIDAIAVTRDNEHVARQINRKRTEQGLAHLTLVPVALIAAEDDVPISSTRVRTGEIDSEGRLFLPSALRPQLAQPMGTLYSGEDILQRIVRHRDDITITVGDVSTKTFFASGVQPALAIIDLKVNRKPYLSFEAYKFPKKYQVVRVVSGPGYIAKQAIQAIRQWSKNVKLRKRMVIVVEGEEDLLVIPAIIHAPVGAIVFYGQPNGALWNSGPEFAGGMVEVTVTAEKKKEVMTLLSLFQKCNIDE